VVVVVADTVLVARGRTGRLDSADQPFVYEERERVVNRLSRNRANIGAHFLSDLVGGRVGTNRDCPQYCQPLGRNLDALLAQHTGRIA
jgi:hypothetical protein